MKLVLKLKLLPDKDDCALFSETTTAYEKACNHLSGIAFHTATFFRIDLHHLAYYEVKTRFDLPAQLVIRAIADVCSAYKTTMAQISEHNRTCKPEERRELEPITFHPNLAVSYDERVLMLDREEHRVSLRTLSKRIWVKFQAGEKRQHLLQYAKGQADLKRYGKVWYLFQTIDVPEGEPVVTTNHLGVDVGICTVASFTDGCNTARFSGTRIRNVRNHHYQLRRGLQRHNTKSSRRRVRLLRNKESRTVRTFNHLVSRRIVEMAQRTNSTIVLEELEGIREGVKVHKSQRRERFCWSYAQLIGFIVYKARLAGIPVMFVPPDYTSKSCSECHWMEDANRQTQAWFQCVRCGFCWPADDNACINIRFLGVESTHQKRMVCMQEYLNTDRCKPLRLRRGS